MDENQIRLPKNLCLTPFTHMTFDPAMNVSPCPALGGSIWNFKGQSYNEIWNNKEYQNFRDHMLDNNKHDVCHRCWNEESVGMKSERTMLWDPNNDPTGKNTFILDTDKTAYSVSRPENYQNGPMQIVIKVGNVCNLRCRSCNSADSITLAVEGQYYADTHGFKKNFYIKETETKVFTDQQIDEIIKFCNNVVRIEFYGGEPLLDRQMPRLLKKLIELGHSKRINLNISTNITQNISKELVEILSNFNHANINLSIDGWGDKFTYLRHPADWKQVYQNIQQFVALQQSNVVNMSLLPVITVTSMNVYYLTELITNIKEQFDLEVFLILAWYPYYYSIKNIPQTIAQEIADKLTGFKLHNLDPIIEAVLERPNLKMWDQFLVWTRMVDEYRGESFSQTFPEYASVIQKHGYQI